MVEMVKVVSPLTFVLRCVMAVNVYTNRRLLLAFVLVLILGFTVIVYFIAFDAAKSLTWRGQLLASELTDEGRLTVFSKHKRARQKAPPHVQSRKVERGNVGESWMISAVAEQQISINRKKSSVWERQDREWGTLNVVIKSILRNEEEWSKRTYEHRVALSDPKLPRTLLSNNWTSVRQSYVYPLLRDYLIRYSSWVPPKPLGEGGTIQLHTTDRKKLCMNDFCLSQLEPSDEKLHFLCLQRSLEYMVKTDLLQNGRSKDEILAGMQCNCKLLKVNERAPRKRVVLSSLPGSGNTWVRQLLESATGICTGSMWCDPSLRANHFCGEGQHGRSFLVIKDHSANVAWSGGIKEERDSTQRKPDYDAMILVHRDPFDATVAEWNRALFDKQRNSSQGRDMHVASYGPEMFGENPEWEAIVHKQAKKWKNMIYNHVINRKPTHPLLVVRYEDLKLDSVREVQRMLHFLDIAVDKDELLQRLEQNSFNTYHRNHTRSSQFNPYTHSQTKYWNSVILDAENSLHSNGITNFIPLRSYLRR